MKLGRALLTGLVLVAPCLAQGSSFVNFESPQTHPLAISADGSRLYAVNTPDNRVAVFSLLRPDRPVLLREIPVGLEPVSVAERTRDELWVTNRLSDSISIVSVSQGVVLDTIYVEDEPADVIFAGNPEVALVSVSGSEELRVFDPQSRAQLAVIPIFGDEPRALAKSSNGATVWLAVHRSGNRTTIVQESQAPLPPPPTNQQLPPAPRQGIIVDADDPAWRFVHGIRLPDYDVFEIDVATRAITRRYAGVGTSLFNIAVHPTSGDLWVANAEARNLVRFEPNLRGHLVDHRVTRITPGATPQIVAHDLNPGVNYQVLPNPAATASALAHPTDLVFTGGGSELWVAAFGTDRLGIVDQNGAVTGFVELGTPGAQADPRTKRGPRGLAAHPTAPRLYVLNRLSMTLSVVDTSSKTVLREMSIGHDPTPSWLASGRGFLYDAKLSGNGTASCATCHVDGEIDGLAWDLGDPGGQLQQVVNGFLIFTMHPMKGPMTTQTLRGLTPNLAPFHWRGDRPKLEDFNPAFDALMGGSQLSAQDMSDYADFMETLAFPPNPNQNLNRTLSTTPAGTSAQEGFNFFTSTFFIPGLTCATCHALPTGSNQLLIPAALLQEPQDFKVPQLRNLYKRRGREPVNGMSTSGFGILHDGSENSVFNLLSRPVFQGLSNQTNNKRKLESFVLSFDTGTAPTVGYSVTVTQQNVGSPQVASDLALLEQQAQAGNCDLVVKGVFRGSHHGFRRVFPGQSYQSDSTALGSFQLGQLTAEVSAGNATLTFLGVPVGSGQRIGIDRDLNGVLDGDEGLQSYGQPSPVCGPQMRLSGNSAPHIGNSLFALVTTNAPASSPGLVLLNVQPANLPFFDVTILVELTGSVGLPATSDASGTGVTELPVPFNQSLVGVSLFAQSVFGSACGQTGLGTSDGLQVTFGQ